MRPIALTLCLALAGPPATAGEVAPAEDAPLPDLKTEIDASVRGLRSLQDPVEGSYGGGVAGTAWVLRALAECPRAYRRADGPFVARALEYLLGRQTDEGAIQDADAGAEQVVVQTRLAAAALSRHADATTKSGLARALGYLREAGLAGPGWDAEPVPEDEAQARARAAKLLAARDGEGFWSGPRGRVIETADAVIALSAARGVLHAAAPEQPPRPARRLPAFEPAEREEVVAALGSGSRFLLGAAREGLWGTPQSADPGITAMVAAALLEVREPRPDDVQAAIDRALAWLLELQRADGSIHDGRLANYTTSAAVLALARAEREEYAGAIARARAFLQVLQADEGEGYSEGDLYYGGVGYGGDERPDLSNLQMALEALAASGLETGDETFQKALTFLQRTQNRSESNDVARVAVGTNLASGDDGGAGYAPGDSKAGFVELTDGTRMPRSYGSMTYALLKCYVLAGLPRDDPRLEAAWTWCRENFTLDVNPGFAASSDPRGGYQGLFYYYTTMAKALDAYGAEVIVDGEGREHAWRAELAGRLIALQRPDGSWVNENSPRWWEGDPVLASSYAMLSLGVALRRGED